MKALILAAGFGIRLLPYSKTIPKPLFTLLSKPMLGHCIDKLVNIGCRQILINTHHLNDQVKRYVNTSPHYNIIKILHEPEILDTGGAIANAEPFLKSDDFFVINCDIISNIDLKKVYEFHKKSNCLSTLVLHDYKKFNKVKIDKQNYIKNFDTKKNGLAFTGVQVLSPEIFYYFQNKISGKAPDKTLQKKFSIIEIYKNLCKTKLIKAFVDKNIFWSDIGTKEAYSMTSLLLLAASQFKTGLDKTGFDKTGFDKKGLDKKDTEMIKEIQIDKLAGDGSDRNWYRASYKEISFIISDHGICMPQSNELLQINAFINIGKHLVSQLKNRFIPKIYNYDKLSGMVILEDLGDIHLENLVKKRNDDKFTLKIYKKVIDNLIEFSQNGFIGFKKQWAYQTQTYSKELILEKECNYFITEFIQNYLKLNFTYNDFSKEFEIIAKNALKHGITGLMHRDMQSRNIMISNNIDIYFIDFQGARSGPLQYDLASLLIDPYVNLKKQIKDKLLQYAMKKLKLKLNNKESQNFSKCYQYCCLTRNMQFLGAFCFLSQTKKKKNFEQYIPASIKSLKNIVASLNRDNEIDRLSNLVNLL